jgi:uncharacterized protein YndB with AHSA1/START domain
MGNAIVKEISINASARRVFEAITDPRQRVKWWGSEGRFQATEMESDLRPGGSWLMRGTRGDGQAFTIRGEYCRIDAPRLLEFTWVADWDKEPQSTVRFELEEKSGVTTVRLTHFGFANEQLRERYQGWPLLLGKLKGFVGSAVSV